MNYKRLPVLFILTFILSIISLIIVTGITNAASKVKLQVPVIQVTKTITPGTEFDESNTKRIMISVDHLNSDFIRNLEDLKSMRAKVTMYEGDYVRLQRIGNKNQVVNNDIAEGYERLSVNLQKPYNAVDFQFVAGDYVSLDCALDYDIAMFISSKYGKKVLSVNTASAGQNTATVRIENGSKVVALCDDSSNIITDEARQKNSNIKITSILMDFKADDAMMIKTLRNNKGTFELSQLPAKK